MAVSFALWCGWMVLCEATSPRGDDRAMQSAVHDVVVSALPVVLRVMLVTPLVEKVVRWVTGYESQGMSLFATLLLGGGNADGTAARAGWVAIAGPSVLGDVVVAEQEAEHPQRHAQSTWAEARQDRGLTERQAMSSSVTKLVMWHWIQPVPYLFVFWVFQGGLEQNQQIVGSIVAVREILYLGATLLACASCPSFLLLDPFTLWNEAASRADRWVRLLAYVLTPHNYVVLCLANRFRSRARLFVMVGAVQVVADFASCYALFDLLTGIIIDAKRAELQPEAPADGAAYMHPTALVCGYAITAVGFLLFWGPLSVIRSAAVAFDRSKHRAQRAASGGCGCALGMGVLYAVVGFVLLAVPLSTDVLCLGYVPGQRPNCESLPVPGRCAAGLCQFKVETTLTGRSDWVGALALDPATQTLFGGSGDHTIKVWRSTDGAYQEAQTLTGHSASVRALALDPASRTLFSGSYDYDIKVWQLSR